MINLDAAGAVVGSFLSHHAGLEIDKAAFSFFFFVPFPAVFVLGDSANYKVTFICA